MRLTHSSPRIYSKFPHLFVILLFCSCANQSEEKPLKENAEGTKVELVVLGIAQDAGYPQTSCLKECCDHYHKNEISEKYPCSLALIDREVNKIWIFEASPSYREQWKMAQDISGFNLKTIPDGIFLSHAHIGHYTGLMQLGHEVMGAKGVKVFAMPRMSKFLNSNGPWDQLIDFGNINIEQIQEEKPIILSQNCKVQAFTVPHRDEYSETVGFKIFGPTKTVLFIPDIDKWSKWEKDIIEEIKSVDFAFIDGTFFNQKELPGRDMSLVPHPFIQKSIQQFSALPISERSKIHFIHFNHSNPMIWDSNSRNKVLKKGFKLAEQKQVLALD